MVESRKSRKTVTKEIIRLVRRLLEREMSLVQIADEVEISISCARSLCEKISCGSSDEEILQPKKGRPILPDDEIKSKIRVIIDRDPSHTLQSIREELMTKGTVISTPTISRYLKKLDYTRKRLSIVPIERNSTRTLDMRQEYCRKVNKIPDANIIFLDETGINLHNKKSYGYSMKNTKCFLTLPANRGKNNSVMMAISIRGIVGHGLVEGSYNGNLFGCFIKEHLKQHFDSNPNDVLVMDNVAFHHRSDIIEMLNEFGISYMFLPPYSPQLNPIEEYFSYFKSKYSSLRPRPINKIQLQERIIGLIQNEMVEFDGWFKHMRTWIERGISRHEFH